MADNDDRAYRYALTAFDDLVYRRDREWSKLGGILIDRLKLRDMAIEACCKVVARCVREQADELLGEKRGQLDD